MTNISTNLRRGAAIALSAATILTMSAIGAQAGSVTGGFGGPKQIEICEKVQVTKTFWHDGKKITKTYWKYQLVDELWRDYKDAYNPLCRCFKERRVIRRLPS